MAGVYVVVYWKTRNSRSSMPDPKNVMVTTNYERALNYCKTQGPHRYTDKPERINRFYPYSSDYEFWDHEYYFIEHHEVLA